MSKFLPPSFTWSYQGRFSLPENFAMLGHDPQLVETQAKSECIEINLKWS